MILAWTQYLPRHFGGGQCIVHGKTLWQQLRTPEGSLAYAPVCEAPDSEANAILEMAVNGTLQVVQEPGSTPKAVIPAHYLPQAGQPQVLQPGATQATAVAPTRGTAPSGTATGSMGHCPGHCHPTDSSAKGSA